MNRQSSLEPTDPLEHSAPIVIREWDLLTGAVWWNEHLRTLFGHEPASSEDGQDAWFNLIHPSDRERVQRYVWSVIENGEPQWSERYRFRRADGSYVWIEEQGNLRQIEGRAVRLLSIIRVVDEELVNETASVINTEEANHTQLVLEKIAAASPDLITIHDAFTNQLLYANHSEIWQGVHSDELIFSAQEAGRAQMLIHPDDLEKAAEFIERRRLLADHEVLDVELRNQHGNQTWGWIRIRSKVFKRDAEGKATQIISFTTNITQQKEAQQKLERTEALFKSAEEVAQIGSYEADLDTLTFRFSDGLFRLFGEEPQSFQPTLDFIDSRSHPDDIPLVRAELNQATLTKQPYSYTRRIYRPDGKLRLLESHGIVIADDSGKATKFLGFIQDITERQKAEQDLKESRDLLQVVIDSNLVAISIYKAVRNEQGKIIDLEWEYANYRVQKLAGGIPLKRRRYTEIHQSSFSMGLMKQYIDVIEQNKTINQEFFIDCQDGMEGWFHIRAEKLNDGLVVNLEDITARKNVEAEIEKHLTILQHSEELALMGSWEYDIARQQFTWSEGMYRLFNLKPGSPVTLDVYLDYAVDADRPVAERIMTYLAESHPAFEDTLQIRVDDQVRTLKINATVVSDEAGQPIKMLGVDWDISELMNSRVKLQQTADNLQAVLDTSPGFIAMFKAVPEGADPDEVTDFQLMVGNQKLAKILGHPLTELLGQSAERFKMLLWDAQTFYKLWKVYATKEPFYEEKCLTSARGEQWLAIGASRQDGAVVLTGIDITNVKQAQAQQQYWLEQLEYAGQSAHALAQLRSSLQNRGKLLRAVSHDLRGHVGVIGSAAQMLDMADNEAERSQMVQMITSNVRHMTQLMTNLLDYARLEAGQETRTIEAFDAVDLLSELGKAVIPMVNQQSLTFQMDGPSTLWVQGDAVNVRRIAQNLVLNAIKYTNTGGVTLTWGDDAANGRWWFQVVDTGAGLSARQLAYLTDSDSFVSDANGTEAQFSEPLRHAELQSTLTRGEGIGLKIVQELVKLLDAQLSVRSKPEEGTQIQISFPLRYT